MKWDCTAVACCLAIDYVPGMRSTEIRLEFNTCFGNDSVVEMTYSVERKTGTIKFDTIATGRCK